MWFRSKNILTLRHNKSNSYKSNLKEELEGVDDFAAGSLADGPPYVVVDLRAPAVVNAHGGHKVSIVQKSGSKLKVLEACGTSQAKA